jgi:hypothetical protein
VNRGLVNLWGLGLCEGLKRTGRFLLMRRVIKISGILRVLKVAGIMGIYIITLNTYGYRGDSSYKGY